jgi:hypothetical protein
MTLKYYVVLEEGMKYCGKFVREKHGASEKNITLVVF